MSIDRTVIFGPWSTDHRCQMRRIERETAEIYAEIRRLQAMPPRPKTLREKIADRMARQDSKHFC